MPERKDHDLQASSELLPVVYDELKKLAASRMAREKPGQSLHPTDLVHEAYLRLTNHGGQARWENRGHFFGAAAEAMRRVLIDRARARLSCKRGGDLKRTFFDQSQIEAPAPDQELLAVDEALERFSQVDPEAAELVKLRYFVGLTLQEISEITGIPLRTTKRQWAYARAWLARQLEKKTGG